MIKFILPFIESFFITVILTYFAIYFSKKIKWSGRKSLRHIHKKGAYRIGGIAMVAAFNLAIILNSDLVITPELFGFMFGTVILLVVGIWDDIREIFWKMQLFFQIAVSFLVFILGIRIYYVSNPFSGGAISLDVGSMVLVSVALVIFWIVLVANAVNWVDGIDGLSGGITFISAITIFLLSFKPEVNQPPIAIIAIILAGTALGFLIFNFNPARIIAGTSGAMFMGFSLAVLSIFSGTKIATAIMVLAIPIIDFVWVIGERMRRGRSIFKPDKNHLHHKLLEIGWSQRKIALSYYLITLIVSFVALNTRAVGKSLTLVFFFVLMVCMYVLINRNLASCKRS